MKPVIVTERKFLLVDMSIPVTPKSPRRLGTWKYSLETDYLPSMDPLHGNLSIVSSPSSHTIGRLCSEV